MYTNHVSTNYQAFGANSVQRLLIFQYFAVVQWQPRINLWSTTYRRVEKIERLLPLTLPPTTPVWITQCSACTDEARVHWLHGEFPRTAGNTYCGKKKGGFSYDDVVGYAANQDSMTNLPLAVKTHACRSKSECRLPEFWRTPWRQTLPLRPQLRPGDSWLTFPMWKGHQWSDHRWKGAPVFPKFKQSFMVTVKLNDDQGRIQNFRKLGLNVIYGIAYFNTRPESYTTTLPQAGGTFSNQMRLSFATFNV